MKPLRDRPIRTGTPMPWNMAVWRRSSRLCATVLPKPMPGSTQRFSRRCRPPGKPRPGRRDTRTRRRPRPHNPEPAASCAALPAHVHQDNRGRGANRPRRRLSPSPVRPVTSLTIAAPASSAAAMTAAWRVSIDTRRRDRRGAAPPGRRGGFPPPARPDRRRGASIRRPRPGCRLRRPAGRAVCDGVGGSRKSPPSLKLSGVTLTIPMIAAGRLQGKTGERLARPGERVEPAWAGAQSARSPRTRRTGDRPSG